MTPTRWLAVVVAGAVLLVGGIGMAASGKPAGPDEAALVKGNDQFAADLYGVLRGRDGNVFFSPYSISNALAMTYAGARGSTATQMAAALRLPMGGDRLHRAFAGVNGEVNDSGAKGGSELLVANALWTQAGLATVPTFQATVKTLYGAALTPLDFRRAPEASRGTINAWVEQQTRDHIKDLVPEGAITPDTRVVLTNAIYFKGTWKYAFPATATRSDAFTVSSGKTVRDVPLMRQRRTLAYLDGGSFQALALPYGAGEQSMIVFLPRKAGGLPEFEKMLTAARLTDWLAQLSPCDVDVTLPRFKVTAEFQLRNALTALGMPLAFSPGGADFSGMATGEPLALSAVIHKAYVDVNEKGTEAAAATATTVATTSLRPAEPEPVQFRADHPFFFVIRDNGTGSLLFAGRLVEPRAT
ncbi:MAG TPA: serpin family protein [Candidatus Methylomirabilis sp.]|nr:serpin family protein [Candidatus Methylomirabilis sp.]